MMRLNSILVNVPQIELDQKTTQTDKVRNYLFKQHLALKPAEIAKLMDLPGATVRRALRTLRMDGQASRTPDHRYFVTIVHMEKYYNKIREILDSESI